LSAALYLARYARSVAVFDTACGRSSWPQRNRNYLGFPGGVTPQELKARAFAQLADYPHVEVVAAQVCDLRRAGPDRLVARIEARPDADLVPGRPAHADGGVSSARGDGSARRDGSAGGDSNTPFGEQREWQARAVVLATGVEDGYPRFSDWSSYVGRSIHWCITCDGYETRDRRVVVLGDDDQSACEAMQLHRFTGEVTLLTGTPRPALSSLWRDRLAAAGIGLVEDELRDAEGSEGQLNTLVLGDGTRLPLDALFVPQEATPRVQLARQLAVDLAEGYITVNTEQRTSQPRVYAAGDVTRLHSHQVSAAVHEGAQAASAANSDLYPDELRF